MTDFMSLIVCFRELMFLLNKEVLKNQFEHIVFVLRTKNYYYDYLTRITKKELS